MSTDEENKCKKIFEETIHAFKARLPEPKVVKTLDPRFGEAWEVHEGKDVACICLSESAADHIKNSLIAAHNFIALNIAAMITDPMLKKAKQDDNVKKTQETNPGYPWNY